MRTFGVTFLKGKRRHEGMKGGKKREEEDRKANER